MNADEIINRLESLGNSENVAGMRRFGIVTKKARGATAPVLKNLAKDIKNKPTTQERLLKKAQSLQY